MPIRFRCAYCNQLMGIARRKAGTVVRCPKCAGQVVVPIPESGEGDGPEQAPQPAPGAQAADGGLFEQSDFEKVFDHGPAAGPQVLHPPSSPQPAPVGPVPPAGGLLPEFDAFPLNPGPNTPARGVFLTSGVLAVICALVVVLMGMAFFLGLLLGRSSQP
jgi:hypothetical protein